MNLDTSMFKIPYSCYINLTSKCNLRCKHCFGAYSFPLKNELTFNDWKKVIDDLIDLKVFYINISGGEPTQSIYFKEFISYLSKKGMHFILTTNGIFSKDIRNFILDNKEYLIGIKISLDGPDEESHCFLRLDSSGKENKIIFKKVLETIFFFKNKGIPLTIASVLHEKNIKKMDKFGKLIKKINPISWFISPIITLGRGNENREILESYDGFNINFWENLKKDAKNNKINLRLIDVPLREEGKKYFYYTCPAAMNFCEIHSDGTVSPCTLSRICIPKKDLNFENIKFKSLEEIWNGKVFNKFRSFMNKGCKGCKMLKKCNKCIAQSFKYFGRGDFPSPFCVNNGKSLGLKNLNHYEEILNEK